MSRTYSSREPPATETITGAPPLARRGSSASRNAWIPGFWSPVVHTVPDGVSAIRGGGDPFRGSIVMLRLTRPPTFRRSTSPLNSRPVPAHPEAITTGVGRTRPAPRSTASVRFAGLISWWSLSRPRADRRQAFGRRRQHRGSFPEPSVPQDASRVEDGSVDAGSEVVVPTAVLARDRHDAGLTQARSRIPSVLRAPSATGALAPCRTRRSAPTSGRARPRTPPVPCSARRPRGGRPSRRPAVTQACRRP